MKILTFFSEKGGVGKTTLTAMFASYLAYHCGEKVYVMDFDAPSFHLYNMRRKDMELVRDPANREFISVAHIRDAYMVSSPKRVFTSYTREEAAQIVSLLRNQTQGRDGYFLLDFPGRFSINDPVYHIAAARLFDLMVVPVDTDNQSIQSAKLLSSIMHTEQFRNLSGGYMPPMMAVWNKESAKERTGSRDWYGPREKELVECGYDILPIRIREILSFRRDPDTFRFLRSTLCYPEKNIGLNAPYLTELFGIIKDRLDGKETK